MFRIDLEHKNFPCKFRHFAYFPASTMIFNLSRAWNRFRSAVHIVFSTYFEVGGDVERVRPEILSKPPRLEEFPSDCTAFDGVLEDIIRVWDDLHAIPQGNLL
jgi:hypothetical protein